MCFRLYTEQAFNLMSESGEPEILRCSLTSTILNLKCLGEKLEEMDVMDRPDSDSSEYSSVSEDRNFKKADLTTFFQPQSHPP